MRLLLSPQGLAAATASGRLRRIGIGPMAHSGQGRYLDATTYVADGRSFRDVTADTIIDLIERLQ